MKSYIANKEKINETHQFHLIDAEGVVLGRLACKVAELLCGKHKPIYTPFLDCGDHVIIVNADKVKLTGNKPDQKQMIRHSRYPGGLKTQSYRELMDKHPDRAVMHAVRGMLPKNKLGKKMLTKLRVYRGTDQAERHKAQQPVETKV